MHITVEHHSYFVLDFGLEFTAELVEKVQSGATVIFQCRECPYNSPWSTSAKRHVMAKHVGIHAFVCDVCPSRFSTQNSLNCHRRKHFDFSKKFWRRKKDMLKLNQDICRSMLAYRLTCSQGCYFILKA